MLLLQEVRHTILRYGCKAILRAKRLRCVATKSCTCELRLELLLRLLLHLERICALCTLLHERLLLLTEGYVVRGLLRHLESWLLKALIKSCLLWVLLLHWSLCSHRLLIVLQRGEQVNERRIGVDLG